MTQTEKLVVIVFDFGAVLVDWNPYYLYRKVMKDDAEIKAFLEEIDFNAWNSQFDKGYPFEKGVEEKCAQFPQRADLIRLFDSHWLDAMGEVMINTVEVARRLKKAGYVLYGLSNWSEVKFNLVKERFEFLNLLEDYLLSGQAQQVKPSPDIYHSLLQKIRRSASECLFIDDSAANIQTAREIGFQTIRFLSAEQLTKDLTGLGLTF